MKLCVCKALLELLLIALIHFNSERQVLNSRALTALSIFLSLMDIAAFPMKLGKATR